MCVCANNKVAGYAVGGGHVLHMVCDLTIAADNAIFGQTGPKVQFLSIKYLFVFVALLLKIYLNPCRLEALMLAMELPSCLVW